MKSTVFRDGKIYEQEYERGKSLYPVKQVGETTKRGTMQTFYPDDIIFTQTTEFSFETLSARMRELSFLNKGITITFTDKRQVDEKGEFLQEVFHSDEGLKEYIRYLDGNREPIISHVISMDNEKGEIPVEVALIYNTSYSENIFLT